MTEINDNNCVTFEAIEMADEEILHRWFLTDEFYHLSNNAGMWFWGD
ncbi:hypothetical protein ISS37_03045 [candidate division KSB1 bacterium]|nr:hypothetical protein [candidate division KSB1 bacterium]